MEPIVNKIANSGLITLDLEEMLTHPANVMVIDIKDFLFQELILKEKDFRTQLKKTDWSAFQNSAVAIINSVEAIVPTWAYMLMGTYLKDNCLFFDLGVPETIIEKYYLTQIDAISTNDYKGTRVVLKGCGKLNIPQSIYARLTNRLMGEVKSLMFGEPCSTVPVYKNRS